MHPGKACVERVIDATVYSLTGFRFAYRHEAALRQENAMARMAIPIAAFIAEIALQRLAFFRPI
ncbi:MAG: hypothetical protein AAGF57_20265 [Pseudomonadota bacterium]